MQIYIKSAGFSVNQDYSWMGQNGDRADMDAATLAYNVNGITFVWKSTGTKIYIFGNSFTDRSRTDLYNRLLRNYILLVGEIREADFMYYCFEKMILDQTGFIDMLNASVRNTDGSSEAGFSVDFERMEAYFARETQGGRELHRMERNLYEIDSDAGRQRLLDELWGVKRDPLTLLVGGELPGWRLKAMAPDRALLDYIDDVGTQQQRTSDNPKSAEQYKYKNDEFVQRVVVGCCVAAATAGLIWLIVKKKD